MHKVNGNAKGGYSFKDHFCKTRTIPEFLYQDRLVKNFLGRTVLKTFFRIVSNSFITVKVKTHIYRIILLSKVLNW